MEKPFTACVRHQDGALKAGNTSTHDKLIDVNIYFTPLSKTVILSPIVIKFF